MQAPEVAFLGRSNVGKSSLLNSLVGSAMARVSSTPGRTRTINFFALYSSAKAATPDALLADLPGYGYAKISRAVSAGWHEFIDPYLSEREALVLCVVIVDAMLPPQTSDRKLLEFLREVGRKFVVVATKSDRISGNQVRNHLRQLRQELQVDTVITYSAKTGAGRPELWRSIEEAISGWKPPRPRSPSPADSARRPGWSPVAT
jgi:GTP-binding protein